MTLVAHFDLELHQMDVKTTFLNGDINETIYMVQPKNFASNESKSMVCKLNKFIYGLKHASLITSYGFEANVVDDCVYHKFHQVITSYGFEANVVDSCVYHKFSESKYIFLVLYVDDILLASSDTCLMHETKRFLMKNFEMKDLGEAYFVLGIDTKRSFSRLSQDNYTSKVLDRFGMKDSKPRDTLIAKGDKFSLNGSLMYAQVCTRLDITFVVRVLGRHLNDLEMQYRKVVKRYMLTYRKSKGLEITRYSDSNFVGCQDSKHSTSGYIYMLDGGAISWKFVKQTFSPFNHGCRVCGLLRGIQPWDMTAKLCH
ncbi:hypothetical protein CR513_24908, partial [Mucuna pruriens]